MQPRQGTKVFLFYSRHYNNEDVNIQGTALYSLAEYYGMKSMPSFQEVLLNGSPDLIYSAAKHIQWIRVENKDRDCPQITNTLQQVLDRSDVEKRTKKRIQSLF